LVIPFSFSIDKGGFTTECVKDLDKQSKMIIYGSILTTFELSSIFGGSKASFENWFEPKTKLSSENLACPNQ